MLSRKMLSRSGFAVFAFLATTGLALTAQAETKIAVVDTQRAMMETEDGLRMQANLKKIFETKQQELDAKQKALESERADIEKQQGVLSQEALQRRVASWQQDMVALQQTYVQFNQELQAKQNELTQPIIEKTLGLIRRLATQEGYDVVVDKQAVPYVRSDLDVTDRVITMYTGGAAAAPAEPGKADSGKTGSTPSGSAPAAPKADPAKSGATPKAKAPAAAPPAK
jgi:outer membrane protein